MTGAQLAAPDALRRFVLAGRAIVTVVSKRTNARRTYRFRAAPVEGGRSAIWISFLNGADSTTNYQFLGTLWPDSGQYRHGTKIRVLPDSPVAQGAAWLALGVLNRPDHVLAQAEVWHEGRCGRCGRRLTVPSSIASGLGPECAGRS